MTLEELAGSLIVGKLNGCRLSIDEAGLLQSGTMSGVMLFRENAESLSQLVELTDSIYKLRGDAVIAVDQEGGAVQRFDHVLTPLPSQMALAACAAGGAYNDAIEKIAGVNCRQLRLLGVNCLLAPVLDIYLNPANPIIGSRSFSGTPQEVGVLGKKYAQAVLADGLIPAGKHFPGHGDVNVDSHNDIPVLSVSKEQLFERELIPFQMCIQDLPALMAGHILVPAIDPNAPASLSHRAITELLRDKLGFDGVIMTDDLSMGAIGKHYDLADAAVKAVAAGADMILISTDCAGIIAVHAALVNAIKKEQLSESNILKSVERIKKVYGGKRQLDSVPARVAELERCLADDAQTCLEVTRAAVRLLRGHAPNLKSGRFQILVPDHPRYRLELCEYLRQAAAQTNAANISNIEIYEKRFSLDPTAQEIAQIVNSVKDSCILLSFRCAVYLGQMQLAVELAKKLGNKLYVIEIDAPALIEIKAVENLYATLDPSSAAIQALAQLLAV